GDVAEIALAEIEADIVPQHQEEALGGWLVEAELLFKLRDELRVEALGAAIARGRPARLEALAGHVGARARSKARVCPAGLPRYLGNHLLDGSARRELYHDEGNEHDAEQCRNHEKQAAEDIGAHQ